MKNKLLTYILLIVVAVIWYQVFFRVKGNLLGDELVATEQRDANSLFELKQRDTIALALDYKDPFRSRKKSNRTAQNLPSPTKPVRRSAPTRPVKHQMEWPKIDYYGMVHNHDKKHPLAIIKEDGIIYKLTIGDELFNEIRVKAISQEEIVFQKKKTEKIYKRK